MARVTGCRSSVYHSPDLTLAVHWQLLHPPSSSPGFTAVHPLLKLRVEFLSSPQGGCSSPLKAETSLSLLPAAGDAAPGPVRRGVRCGQAQRSLPRAAKPTHTKAGSRQKAARRQHWGSQLQAPPPPSTADPRAPPLPFLRPRSWRRGEPAALPPPAARAAAPPPCRDGGSWLPRGPSEGRLQGGLKTGPPRGERGDPGETSGRRQNEVQRASRAGGRAGPPSPRAPDPAHGRALAGGLGSALREAETAGWVAETARCLFSLRRPSCLTSIVLGRFLKVTEFGRRG